MTSSSEPLLRRLAETDRPSLAFVLDGAPAQALEGDTILTAVLTQHGRLRHNEFSLQPRAGFCLMGACQECWVRTADGRRLRACSQLIEPGMALETGA